MVTPLKKSRLALVLSGGGARGAYEAGVVNYIRTQLPKEVAARAKFDLHCGSSVGAINSCFMASTAQDPKHQGEKMYALWKALKQDDIYKRNIAALSNLVGRSLSGIGKNIFGLSSPNPRGGGTHFTGLLDTAPFHNFMEKIIPWESLHRNIASGTIDAVSLTATNMSSGKMELFLEKHDSVRYSGHYPVRLVKIAPDHARASAAIPIVFPTIKIGQHYYADGGLRLNTPLSPAIHLGADRLLVIGMHPVQMRSLEERTLPPFDVLTHSIEDVTPPTLGEVIGIVLNSLFLDRIDYDLEQLARINRIVDWGETTYGTNFIDQINQTLVKKRIRGDIASRGLKRLHAFSIFPSEAISEIFADCLSNPALIKKHLGAFEKFILRMLDIDLVHGQNFLSYMMFIPEYIERLLELGFEDAKKNHDGLVEFFLTEGHPD